MRRLPRRRGRLSVRARTTIVATTVVGLATVAIGLLLVGFLESRLTDELDSALDDSLKAASSQVKRGSAAAAAVPGTTVEVFPGVTTVPRGAAWQASKEAVPLAKVKPRVVSPAQRVAQATVDTPEGTKTLVASVSTDSVRRATQAATLALLFGAPVLLAVVAALTWLSTGRALRPVDAIRREFARLSAHDLRGRMPVPAGGDALARLAGTLNETLDRLDGSVRRQRQFVADASHELRSPLAALRTPLEVARAHPDKVDWPDLADGTLTDLDRLEQLVADMLTLARIDASEGVDAEPVELGELLAETVERRQTTGRTWLVELANGVVVRGHRSHLARLVTNLLDNAERYARTERVLRLSVEDGHARVDVTDDGPGIPAESRELVFERFTRLDTARERKQGGAGLGLALARDIATLHGGTLELVDSERGAHFVARLPAVAGVSAGAR